MFWPLKLAKFFFLTTTALVLGIFSPTIATSAPALQIYRLPMPELTVVDLPKPEQPLAGERAVRIFSSLQEGPYGARVLELKPNASGFLRRAQQYRVNLLQNLYPQDMGRNICELLLGNDLATGFSHYALNVMANRGYFGGEAEAARGYAAHIGRPGEAASPNIVYLESVSWFSAETIRKAYPGAVPWSFIAEVEAPAHLDGDAVRALVESGAAHVRVRLRRAMMRVVASLGILPVAQMPAQGSAFFSAPLPFEIDPHFAGLPLIESPIRFEWGRAAKADGFQGDSEILAQAAAMVSAHYVALLADFSPVRARDALVFAQSYQAANTRLYQRGLGMEPQETRGGITLLAGPLDQVLARLRPEQSLEFFAQAQAFSSDTPGAMLAHNLVALARTNRLDLDLVGRDARGGRRRFVDLGPVVLRDYSAIRGQIVSQMLAPGRPVFSEAEQQSWRELLASQPEDPGLRDSFYFRDDFPSFASELGLRERALVISNLSPTSNIPQLLRSVHELMLAGLRPMAGFPEIRVLVLTRHPTIAAQIQSMPGFQLHAERSGVQVFAANMGVLGQLPEPVVNAVQAGYWERSRLVTSFPGL